MAKKCKKQLGGVNNFLPGLGDSPINTGFPNQDPAVYPHSMDPYKNILQSAMASALGDSMSSQAYYNFLLPNNPKKAKANSQRSAVLSGLLGAATEAVNQYGQRMDYNDYAKWIARQQAGQYNRLPYDRYAYNEFTTNPFNQGPFANGGMVGESMGSAEPEGIYESMPDEMDEEVENYNDTGGIHDSGDGLVYFDATSSQPVDQIPVNNQGIDFSQFVPTLGNTPTSFNFPLHNMGDVVETAIAAIGQHESGGNYNAVNRSGGRNAINATGKYQFVPKYWYKEIASYMGIPSDSQDAVMSKFQSDPGAQEGFMRYVVTKHYMPQVQRLGPLAAKYNIDTVGLIKMLHYRGLADTEKRLKTGNFEVSNREKALYNNPDILSYVQGR